MYVAKKTATATENSLVGHTPPLSTDTLSAFAAPSSSPNLINALDAKRGIFWSSMRPEDGRGCFTRPLLREMKALGEQLDTAHRASAFGFPSYFVSASAIPGTYNLGGDLNLFADRIRNGDRATVSLYAHACIDVVHQNARAFGLPMITIGLIQGDALGGGLECALSYDVIVAERSAKIGLPEVVFNLFPGMGAYSFLSRKIGRIAAERLILSGKTYSAEELHTLGVVDVLADDGQGVAEVHNFVDRSSKRLNSHLAVYKARRRVEQVTEGELRDVVDIWTDAAMSLRTNDLRMMDRLGSAQKRRLSPISKPAEMALG